MTTGLFTGASKNAAGFYSAIIENTGLGTKYFGVGKFAPKIAANTWVEFEHSNRQVGDKTYYNVEGKLKETEAPANASRPQAQQTSNSGATTNSDPRQASIEMQSSISSASRIVAAQITAGVNISNPAAAVGSLVQSFIDILHPKAAAPKEKPKPAEDDDEFPA